MNHHVPSGTVGRLLVQGRAGVDEIRDIRNVDPHVEVAVGEGHAVQRVVNVLAALFWV